MPEDFPRLKDGDQLEPWHLNVIYAELARWRKLRGAGGVTVSGAAGDGGPLIEAPYEPPMFIKLTGTYSSGYPWVQVLIGPARALTTTAVTGNAALGNPAVERQTNDTTLTADGTVYEAKRCPGSNLLVFDGKN